MNRFVAKMKSTQLGQARVWKGIAKVGDVEERISEIGFNPDAFAPQVSSDWEMSASPIKNARINNVASTLISAVALMKFLIAAMVQSAGVESIKMEPSRLITRKSDLLI